MANSTNNANTNEFDIKAPSITDDMVSTAFDSTTTANAAEADTSYFDQSFLDNINPTAYTASTLSEDSMANYTPYEAKGIDYNVANNQTAQGQLEGIIASNSPLMQQAENRAMRKMNERGLLNSSMAVGAGQAALYDYAVPIAQTDAGIYADAAAMNTETKNRMELANQAAKNRAYEFGAAMSQEGGLANMAALNDASQYNLGIKTDFAKYIFGEGLDLSKFNADQRQEVNLTAAETANKFTSQLLSNAFDARLAEADSDTKVKLQTMDSATRLTLGNLESDYKLLMQSSSSASDLYQQVLANIAESTSNPDLDADALDSAINQQLSNLSTGLLVLDTLNPVISGLADLLDFGPTTEES